MCSGYVYQVIMTLCIKRFEKIYRGDHVANVVHVVPMVLFLTYIITVSNSYVFGVYSDPCHRPFGSVYLEM